ncbi:MAG: tRNA pseudouridine(38-40) synthase TruA [Methanosarcinales archaeon]|nr:MAG: tRNA pseudouridine(38-40) synthase TruA [Methanosarcinales archaeon]
MRIALKIAYIGTDYHGFQVQPDVNTIEGELFRALKELNIINNPHEANYIAAGRTDRGVHALGQVIAFDTDNPDIVLPRAVNNKLPPTIWAWASAQVSDDFDPRRDALSREYRYIMCGKYNISLLRNASRLLKGVHDFSNFSTPDNGRSSISMVQSINVRVDREFMIIDIQANHFVWHMVRKIATALKMVGSGARDLTWLEQMLSPGEYTEGLEPAPPYGLTFKDVEYRNMIWREDTYAKKTIIEKLDKEFLWHGVMAEMLRELKEGLAV